MSGGWFVTGTDTGVGKTRVARLLLEALAQDGKIPATYEAIYGHAWVPETEPARDGIATIPVGRIGRGRP
jgi:hypothetical protein